MGGIAVVLVTHDTRDEVLDALRSLPDPWLRPLLFATAEADAPGEVVVVDNGSHDGTADAVRAAFPTVRVLELANAGFGRGANAGVRATTAPVVVVANADVRFEGDALHRLAAELERDPGLGAVGPRVRYPDGSQQASARRLPSLPTAIGHGLLGRVLPRNRWTMRYRAEDVPSDLPHEADWLSGCVLALRRAAFDEVGGFDPGYFLYVEDVDLSLRLRDAGWRLRFLPQATVAHQVGASTGARRASALAHHARSLDRFYGRRYAGRVARALRPLVRLGLTGWMALTWLSERLGGASRSRTGERVGHPGDDVDAPDEGDGGDGRDGRAGEAAGRSVGDVDSGNEAG